MSITGEGQAGTGWAPALEAAAKALSPAKTVRLSMVPLAKLRAANVNPLPFQIHMLRCIILFAGAVKFLADDGSLYLADQR